MIPERQSWRDLQDNYKKKAARKRLLKRISRLILFIPLLIIVYYTLSLSSQDPVSLQASVNPDNPVSKPVENETLPSISKQDVQNLIQEKDLSNIRSKSFDLGTGDNVLHVDTSIDTDLQNYILDQIESVKKLTRGKPRYLAIVVLDPETGKVLCMAGFDSTSSSINPCISTEYPAASIFKIVTAAAAVEQCGFNPHSGMKFNGGKYTLYRRQLKDKTNKHTNSISFADSFAQSVNPVFGKIGSLYLGKNTLEKYASAFGFNRDIHFEAPLSPSAVTLTDEPYQWAEIACGFNRKTLLSPLHGALLSGTILNQGRLIEPTIIDQITDDEGQVVYNGNAHPLNQAIRPETSNILKKLMATTIRNGTGRKSFKGYLKDPVLGRLNIGGKTGSIYNTEHDVRIDWFVGFAEEKNGPSKVALSVLVGHEKYIGTKACKYARMVMKHYFGNQFAKNDTKHLLAQHDQEQLNYRTR